LSVITSLQTLPRFKKTVMKNKIFLIAPPIITPDIWEEELKHPPLGLAFLASVLRQHDYEPIIFDSTIERNPFQKIKSILKKEGFEIIGIGFSSIAAEGAFRVAEEIKKINPQTIVIAGGYHPTAMTKEVLENKNFDFVVFGEGEITIIELLKSIKNNLDNIENIKGVAFRKNGKIVINQPRPLIENLDTIPLPAYDLLQLDAYSIPSTSRKPYITYIRSRGCPFSCNFCGVQKMFGRKYRLESLQKTIKNMENLIENYNIKEIIFKDSEFVINKESVNELCNLLIEKKYDLTWACNARVDTVSKNLLIKMKNAGCNSITYGVESGDQKTLDRIGKQITLDQSRNAIKLTKDAKIRCVANFIIGLPEETEEAIKKTIKFAKELDTDFASFGHLIALPGSDIYDEAIKNNWFINGKPDYFSQEKCKINATKISTEKLEKFLKKAIISFYFRPKYIMKRLLKLNATEIKNNFVGLWYIIKKFR
jgi:anaerobic magnesium-protoporphyrin IX monomethyl ester cyclase